MYSWTDRRGTAVDKAWWQNQMLRSYVKVSRTPEEPSIGEVVAPGERLAPPQLLKPDLREANEMLAKLASRSSCREHTFLIDGSSEEEATEIL